MSDDLRLILENEADTRTFGRMLADCLTRGGTAPLASIYLYGDLGTGKTTLARELVDALPGGHLAEVASPSFTLCHEYPTTPPVLHADLYRLGPGAFLPEEMEDGLESGSLLLLEWAEYLAPEALHDDRLDIRLSRVNGSMSAAGAENLDINGQSCERRRSVVVRAHGTGGRAVVERLRGLLQGHFLQRRADGGGADNA